MLFQQYTVLRFRTVFVHQLLDHSLQQIDLHGLQVRFDTGVLRILLRQRCQQRLQCLADGLVIELAQLVGRLALPLRQAGELLVQTHFQPGNVFVITLALGFGQLGELGFVQRLAFLHGREGDIGAVAIESDLLFQGELLDHIQRLVVALIEAAVDGALLLLETRMLEYRRKGRQQVVDQLIDIGDERRCAAVRQLQHTRLARLVEVVHVNPVRRRIQTLAFGLEVAPYEREASGARLSHHVDVVSRTRHGHAELQRLDRALLAEHTEKRLQFRGVVEVELAGLEGTGQRIGCQAQAGSDSFRHRESLLGWLVGHD